MNIVGSVDGFRSPIRLHGWARHSDPSVSEIIEVRVCRDNEVIGRAENILPRPDIGGSFGFQIQLEKPIEARDIEQGSLVVRAVSGVAGVHTLPFYRKMVEQLRVQNLAEHLKTCSDEELGEVLRLISQGATTGLKRQIPVMLSLPGGAEPQTLLPGVDSEELSMVGLKPGLVSPDRSTVIGRSGYLFLYGGTNHVLHQYQDDGLSEEKQKLANEWVKLFSARKRELARRGAKYLQLIIPEKVSVVPEYFPISLKTPTALMHAIEEAVARRPNLERSYLNCLDLIKASPSRKDVFLRIDTHLSAVGCFEIASAIAKRIGYSLGIRPNFKDKLIHEADLGGKFGAINICDQVMVPAGGEFTSWEEGLISGSCKMVPDNHHIGTTASWFNSTAPIPLRVVVFGNSFFQLGHNPHSLSWWGKRLFTEFHFVWSPNLELEYVDEVKPDLVVCQTIERFLNRLPER